MTIFLTGATGYIGSYVANGLLRDHGQKLALLVRAKSEDEGEKRLWQSLQLHMDFPTFYEHVNRNVKIVADYELTTFDGGAASGADRGDEHALFTRFQIGF